MSSAVKDVAQDAPRSEDPDAVGFGCWMPVASCEALRDLNPHRVKIAGIDVVVWHNKQTNKWSVQTDVCPHKLAPLSQGRVDQESGCIECPYHGWQFDSDGACKSIPQLDDMSKVSKTRASLTTFPTHTTGDLLWAFIPSAITGESYPVSMLPEEHYPVLKSSESFYYMRELPYSWDFLVENFMDPGHIPFAHHSLQGVRSDGSPIDMEVLANNFTHVEVGYKDLIRGKPRDGVVSFQRPVYYHFRTRQNDGKFKENVRIMSMNMERKK